MDKLLDQKIDEAVAEYILDKVDEYKASVDEAYKKKLKKQSDKLLEHVNEKLEAERASIRKEYAAKATRKLAEKDEQIASLESQFDDYKLQLAERVNTFLANSKDEVRSLVEEEARLDAKELKAQNVLEQIKGLVGNTKPSIVERVDDAKVARLTDDIKALKERVDQKTKYNKYLAAQVKKYELLESVPAADRPFYDERLDNVQTVEECENRFAKIAKAVKAYRKKQISEEVEFAHSKGQTEDKSEFLDYVNEVEEITESTIPSRWRELAGIKN